MRTLIVFLLVGFGAQLVDGSLGMAYGITATTMALLAGATAAQASFAVNLAQVGTTLASGASHWKFGNVDVKTVAKLGLPGMLGAFVGATLLSNISTEAAQPLMTTILVVLGFYLLLRFGLGLGTPPVLNVNEERQHSAGFLAPVGTFGGFLSATGGGGWGPLTVTTLMTAGKTTPRRVIGSVSASEFLVSLAASIGFLFGMGDQLREMGVIVLGLLAGGVIAAPFAAWLVSRVNAVVLGTFVGGLLVVLNLLRMSQSMEIDRTVITLLQIAIGVLTLVLGTRAWRRTRAARDDAQATPPAEEAAPGHEQGTDGEHGAGHEQRTDEDRARTHA
ncbi:sulfite exporter TauE/SafE family protein [Dietzia sp. 179-F 9C3 NHS]|uniref:sulfite exporter TauE/SafE family protein n=1 Tax=Dietzia sp. 179-F 9C3 NHS TaxID=3374295 RepID=UPI003879C3A1